MKHRDKMLGNAMGTNVVTYVKDGILAIPGVGALAGALMYAGRGQQKFRDIEGRVVRLEGGAQDFSELREAVARIDERTLEINRNIDRVMRALTPGRRNGG